MKNLKVPTISILFNYSYKNRGGFILARMFTKQDINIIQNGYNRFILENVKNETYNQYVAIVEEYLRDIVMYKVIYGEYTAIFSDENIKNFRKEKSIIARRHLIIY